MSTLPESPARDVDRIVQHVEDVAAFLKRRGESALRHFPVLRGNYVDGHIEMPDGATLDFDQALWLINHDEAISRYSDSVRERIILSICDTVQWRMWVSAGRRIVGVRTGDIQRLVDDPATLVPAGVFAGLPFVSFVVAFDEPISLSDSFTLHSISFAKVSGEIHQGDEPRVGFQVHCIDEKSGLYATQRVTMPALEGRPIEDSIRIKLDEELTRNVSPYPHEVTSFRIAMAIACMLASPGTAIEPMEPTPKQIKTARRRGRRPSQVFMARPESVQWSGEVGR